MMAPPSRPLPPRVGSRRPRGASRRRPSLDVLECRRLLAAPGLSIRIQADAIEAGSGPGAAVATVTRTSDDLSRPMTVALTSSAPGSVAVPDSVVIAAGQASATFGLDAPADDETPGTRVVVVGGSATFDGAFGRDATFDPAPAGFEANAVATQADGKVVVAGTYVRVESFNRFAVRRYEADGTADDAFRNGAAAIFGQDGLRMKAQAVAVQDDGRILVGGTYQELGKSTWNMLLARLTPDGDLDATFGDGGWVSLTPTSGSYNEIWDLAVQPDGKILIGGAITHPETAIDFAVARLDEDGSLDPSFGDGGYASTSFTDGSDRGFDLALQPDGKILLAGETFGGNATSNFGVVRWTADGRLDPDFGTGGKVQTDLPGSYDRAWGLAIQPDGRIVVAGSSSSSFVMARYTASGTLDDSFGDDGVVAGNTGGAFGEIGSVAAAADDGRLAVAIGSGTVARFDADGNFLDSASGGVVVDLAIQPGGRIIAVDGAGGVRAYGDTAVVLSAYASVEVIGTQVPRAVGDAYDVEKGVTLAVSGPGLLGNDASPSGKPLAAVLVDGPSHGSLRLQPDGSFTYTPAPGYLGPDGFTYRATDGTYTSSLAAVVLDVDGPNDPPVAADDAYGLRPGSPLTIAAPGLLANDADPNGHPIAARLAEGPAHGTLTLHADGSFTYTPDPGWIGPDAFTYRADDGASESAVATVRLIVADSSDNEWTQRGGDGGHTGYVDARLDAGGITQVWSRPLDYVSRGIWARTDNRAVAIGDRYVYRTDLDGYWASGDYHVTAYDLWTGVQVWDRVFSGGGGPVSAPSFADGRVYVNRSGHSGNVGGALEDLPWLYALDALTGETVARRTYPAQWGSDERPAIDGGQLVAESGYYGGIGSWSTSPLVTGWTTRGPQLQQPLAAFDDLYIYAYDDKVYRRSTGEYDGEIAAPAGFSGPFEPVVSGAGRVLFTLGAGEAGYGVASYDAGTRSPIWTVALTAPPVAKAVGGGVVAVAAGRRLILLDEETGARLGGWEAPYLLSSELVLTRTHAFVETWTDDYSRVYAINLATGQAEWSYENRAEGESRGTFMHMAFGGGHLLLSHDTFVMAFAVPGSSNLEPTALDDAYATAQGSPLIVSAAGVLGNDREPDSEPMSAVLAEGPAHGTLDLAPDGSFVYTPAPGFAGVDRFRYRATDGRAASRLATVTLVVDGTPIASGAGVSLVQGGSRAIALAAADPEGSPLTFAIVSGPAHGTLTGSGPDLVYTPAPGYSGPDGFTFAASDGRTASAPATVSILVKPALAVAWDDPAAIVYGAPLGPSQLDAVANVEGTFVYIPGPGTVLEAGAGRPLTAVFVPADPDYPSTPIRARIDVRKATPTVSWPAPAPITYGTPLGASQRGATASVPGTFRYAQAPGTILGAGAGRPLTAVFVPDDATNYETVAIATTIDVRKAVLTVVPGDRDVATGEAAPPLSYTLTGLVAGDPASVVAGAPILATLGGNLGAAGRYPIWSDVGTLSAANYDFRFGTGVLTVHPRVLDVRARWGGRSVSLLGLGRPLPFADVAAIDVVFTDPVAAGPESLSLASTSAAGGRYAFVGYRFDPSTNTATWSLPTALGADDLILALDGPIGATADPTIAVAGPGPVAFRVAPGDVDGDGRATLADAAAYGRRPPAALVAWMDLDGDGDADRSDQARVRRAIAPRRPVPRPQRPPFPTPAGPRPARPTFPNRPAGGRPTPPARPFMAPLPRPLRAARPAGGANPTA